MIDPQLTALGVTPTGAPPSAAPSAASTGPGVSSDMAALGVVASGPSPAQPPAATPAPASGGFSLPQVPTPFTATGHENQAVAGLKTLGNLVPSAINTGVGLVEMPFKMLGDAAKGIGQFGSDIGTKGLIPSVEDTFGQQLPNYLYQNLVPNLVKHGLEYGAGAIANAAASSPSLQTFINAAAGKSGAAVADPATIRANASALQDNALTPCVNRTCS